MKKIFFLIALAGLGSVSQAQTVTGSGYGNAIDTVVNTGTYYLTTSSLATVKGNGYAFQIDAINKTGTTTITAVLESSLDGTTWSRHFKTPGQTGVNCDTLAISGTTSHVYNILPGATATYNLQQFQSNSGRRLYFRVKLVGGATGTTQVYGKLIPQ